VLRPTVAKSSSRQRVRAGIRGALGADDVLAREHREIPFRVRETHEWKLHAAHLESELLKRDMAFDPISCSDQAEQPTER
jgi:hypothetical protein